MPRVTFISKEFMSYGEISNEITLSSLCLEAVSEVCSCFYSRQNKVMLSVCRCCIASLALLSACLLSQIETHSYFLFNSDFSKLLKP